MISLSSARHRDFQSAESRGLTHRWVVFDTLWLPISQVKRTQSPQSHARHSDLPISRVKRTHSPLSHARHSEYQSAESRGLTHRRVMLDTVTTNQPSQEDSLTAESCSTQWLQISRVNRNHFPLGRARHSDYKSAESTGLPFTGSCSTQWLQISWVNRTHFPLGRARHSDYKSAESTGLTFHWVVLDTVTTNQPSQEDSPHPPLSFARHGRRKITSNLMNSRINKRMLLVQPGVEM